MTGGFVVLIDEADWPLVKDYHWYPKRVTLTTYARRNMHGITGPHYIHQLILAVPSDAQVDHKDGDGLDNRRSMLRPCTHHQNQRNKLKRMGCSSKYKGVSLHHQTGKWVARIKHNRTMHPLGCFNSEKDAALTYDYYARLLFKEFASPNFDAERFRFADICARAQKKKKKTSSKFWGVHDAGGSFRAVFRGKSLGYSTDEVAQSKRYDAAAFARYGVFAKLNFPAEFGLF